MCAELTYVNPPMGGAGAPSPKTLNLQHTTAHERAQRQVLNP